MEENNEDISQSTTFNGLERLGFRKNWTPLFPQKSADFDTMSNLTISTSKDFNVESDFDSLQCDSTIQNEASHLANNIFNDIKSSDVESYDSKSDFHSIDDKNSDTFLVSASNEVVVLKDFAFGDQRNFFEMPDDLTIPLSISNIPLDQSPKNIPLDNSPHKILKNKSSLNIPKVPICIKAAEELSLIEEITENSSLSTVKSNEVTPRNIFDALQSSNHSSLNEHSVHQQLQETPIMLQLLNSKSNHKPKIVNSKSATEILLRNKSTKMHRISNELDSTLPSKSTPSTPRDQESAKERKSLYTQNKPKIKAKRYIRSSPPREAKPESPVTAPPIQTKTGLTVTQPKKEFPERSQNISRSASSASLLLRSSPMPLNRMISLSSGNISNKVPNFKKGNYDHVESKVKQYIKEIKDSSKERQSNVSKSCSNLSSNTIKSNEMGRPKTADALTQNHADSKSILSSQGPVKNDIPFYKNNLLRARAKSKSETNLHCSDLFESPFQLSKSALSMGNIDRLLFPSDNENEDNEILNNENIEEMTVEPEDLLELVFKERHDKQEAKKVLNELQTNYEDLLQKFAAAENALDKVRFGAKPPPDTGSRQEAFKLAEKVAEKIASYEVERNFQTSSSNNIWLEHLKQRKNSLKFSNRNESSVENFTQNMSATQRSINILNQASGLEMAVKCGVVGREEACMGLVDLSQSLEQIMNQQEDGGDNETKTALAEVSRKLDELKDRLQDQKDSIVDLKVEETAMEMNFETQTPILAAIQKVSDWQRSLPPPPNIPSCYGSLPASPTPSDRPVSPNTHIKLKTPSNLYSLDLDSGCPGSDRSTLWLSYLQSKRMSPSSKSKSRENLGTPLYDLVEEKTPVSPPTQRHYLASPKDRVVKSQITPKDIIALNNQFVSSVTIEQGVKLTPRAESELQNIGKNEYRNIFRDHKELYYKQQPISGKHVGNFPRNNPPNMTSTPIKSQANIRSDRVSSSLPCSPHENKLIRSNAISNLKAASQPDYDFSEMTETLTATQTNIHHITDLSSDELDIIAEHKLSSDQSRLLLATPAKMCKSKNPSKCLFPSNQAQGPQSQILAQQIDNEILELRNFFEDHREEMMTLLHGGGAEMEEKNMSLPVFHQIRKNSQDVQKSSSMTTLNQLKLKTPILNEDELKGFSLQYLESQRTTPDLPDPSDYPIFQDTQPHILDARGQNCEGIYSSLQYRSTRYDSESDAPDKTLLLKKREFEKRRFKKEKLKRQLSGQNKSVKHFHPELMTPRAKNIQSFFPVEKSNFKDQDEDLNSPMNASLPTIPHLEKNLYSGSYNEAWTDTNENLLLKSSTKPAQYGSDTSHLNFVPRLNLSDICSDITAPSQSLDYSFQSSIKNSNQLNIFRFNHKDGQSFPSSSETQNQSCKYNRSIACDTFDLSQNMVNLPTSSRTTPGDERKIQNMFGKSPGAPNQSLPVFPRSSSLDQFNRQTPRLARDHDNLCSSMEQAEFALKSVGLRADSPAPVIIINQTNCGQKCGKNTHVDQSEKNGKTDKPARKKKNKKPSKELVSLLESLDAATVLAQKLKKRSENMLEILGSDITITKTDKSGTSS